MSEENRKLRIYLPMIISALLVLPMVVFVLARVSLPSEGARVEAEQPPDPRGWFISPIGKTASPLRSGDVLLEVEGVILDELLNGEIRSGSAAGISSHSELQLGILREGESIQVSVPLTSYPILDELRGHWSLYFFLLYLMAISLVVFLRRPHLPAARQFLLLSAANLGSGVIYFIGLQPSDLLRGWMLGLWLFGSIFLYGYLSGALVHFSLVFPKPRAWLEHRRWLLIPVYLGIWIPFLVFLLLQWPSAPTPSSQWILLMQATGLLTTVSAALYIFFAVRGYRSSFNERERRQVRWVLWGLLIGVVPWIVLNVLPPLLGMDEQLGTNWLGILGWTIPTAFAIAILRENLFDIDTLINKSLVYGTLTALLALVYFGSVLLLQRLVPGVSQLVIVASTLFTAALFAPLRNRIQSIIDRRFYRRRFDAERTLVDFSHALRQEVEFDRISSRLMTVAAENIQPESISIWIAPEPKRSSDS